MKKILILITALLIIFNSIAYAYTFPEPDWGALLKEREKMVTQSDFELYTEGSIESAPYYGAKFEPRGGTYIGMVAENSQQVRPLGSYLTYIQDMGQNDLYIKELVQTSDVVTMVGWTITDINNINYDHIRNVLNTLNEYNKPMCIRFANEMNESSIGSDPYKYVEVFKKVANMIHEYPNFAVVWSPMDLGALDRPFEAFYPGDEYVDWIGVSSYCIKYFLGNRNTSYGDSVYFMTGAYSWTTNKLKPIIEFMEKNNINKPVMISEGGVATGNIYGENNESWAAPRLRHFLYNTIMKYPQVKMINYFNVRMGNENEQFDISNYPYMIDIFNEAAQSGAYIRKADTLPNFVYQPANKGETLKAKDGIVKLHTLAYFPNKPDISVHYLLDDVWYHVSSQIPYTCNLDISKISDGKHTMKIISDENVKEYTFYKTDEYICFGEEPKNVPVKVTLNNNKLSFVEPPIIVNNRTVIPLRTIFELLGADVSWNEDTRTITSTYNSNKISLSIESNKMYINEREVELDVPAQIINNITFVPVRAISEAFNCKVDWNAQTRTVCINKD